MSMLENLKKAEEQHDLGSSAYKLENGNNIVRVLCEGVPHESTYKDGSSSVKFIMWVIDRRTKRVKPFFASYGVYKQIAQLETDPFYAFSGMPMPYDVNIVAENAGTVQAKYKINASPTKSDLTGEEIEMAREKGSILDYIKELDKTQSPGSQPNDDAPLPSEDGTPFK
jgi:hypothetical protein